MKKISEKISGKISEKIFEKISEKISEKQWSQISVISDTRYEKHIESEKKSELDGGWVRIHSDFSIF